MDAPAEIRGEFRPIVTNVPGIQICEHLPRLARIMDKLVPIRTVYGSPTGDHDSFICYTGRTVNRQPTGDGLSVMLDARQAAGDRRRRPFRRSLPMPRCCRSPALRLARPSRAFLGSARIGPLPPTANARLDLMRSMASTSSGCKTARGCWLAWIACAARSTPAARCRGYDAFTEQQALGVLASSQLAGALDISARGS